MELLKFHGIPWNFYSRCGDSMEFHGIPWNLVLTSSSMELSKFHGIPWNFPFDPEKFHGIPWNSMELWNIDINKFHNWGSVFHCLLYDLMSLYIRQSISSWNIEIFQFQSNFLVPLNLVKWRYSILNGGLFKTSYRKISWSLEAARLGFKLFQSLWHLAGTSAALLPMCL